MITIPVSIISMFLIPATQDTVGKEKKKLDIVGVFALTSKCHKVVL